MASRARKKHGAAPGKMSLSKFFSKPSEVSEQDGEVLPLVEKDFDREVSDCEIEDVLQMLLGQDSDVRLGSLRQRDGMLVDSEGSPSVSGGASASDTSSDSCSHSSMNLPVVDIGCIIKPTMTADEICGAVKWLDKGQMLNY